MSRTLRPLTAFAMVALISVISAGCGSNASSETGAASSTGAASDTGTASNKPRLIWRGDVIDGLRCGCSSRRHVVDTGWPSPA